MSRKQSLTCSDLHFSGGLSIRLLTIHLLCFTVGWRTLSTGKTTYTLRLVKEYPFQKRVVQNILSEETDTIIWWTSYWPPDCCLPSYFTVTLISAHEDYFMDALMQQYRDQVRVLTRAMTFSSAAWWHKSVTVSSMWHFCAEHHAFWTLILNVYL